MKKKFSKILGVGLTLALLFSLLLTAAPVSADVSNITVLLSDYEISATADYTVTFRVNKDLPDTTGTITVVFPEGTDASALAATGDMTMRNTDGIWLLNANTTGETTTAVTVGADKRTVTIAITTLTNSPIGAGASVELFFNTTKIKNPDTAAADLFVTVATSTETTAVASPVYAVTVPTILPLPGVVERYNSAGVLMAQTNSIQAAINASSAGDTILVGAGTYDEIIDVDESVAITGDAATTIIEDVTGGTIVGGLVTISYVGSATTGATFDGFTIKGNLTQADALLITGHKVTVQNCVFTKAGTATTVIAQNMIHYNPLAAPTLASTITNNTFDTTLGTKQDVGVLVAATTPAFATGLTISNNTFVVDQVAVGTEDSAVNTAGVGTALLPIAISGNTISGGGGIGVTISGAGVATKVTSNTLSSLNQALNITGTGAGAVTVEGNTIDACGLAVGTQAAIQVVTVGTGGLSITNNTITNCPNDIIEVDANADLVNMMFNNMTGNTLGVDNDDTNTLNATHNWWGAATGPAAGMNVPLTATTGLIDATAPLGATAVGTFSLATAAVTAAATQKVDVSIANATTGAASDAAIIGVANYSANPGAATPYPAISGGFFDVYIGTPTALADVATIKLYGAAVTANTKAYVYSALGGTWALCDSQGINTVGGYVWVRTGLTITPAIGDLAGTAFALVEAPITVLATAPTILSPVTGDDTVRLRPVFGWSSVAGADGYYFQLADNADFIVPLVKMEGDMGRLSGTTYAYVGDELPYSTPYHWRVKAVSGTIGAGNLAESDWTGGVFITMDEPVEPTPPVVVEEQPPVIIEPIVEVEVITPAVTEITPAWIYVIIGVGGVLVIALLVLIVRTRRVA